MEKCKLLFERCLLFETLSAINVTFWSECRNWKIFDFICLEYNFVPKVNSSLLRWAIKILQRQPQVALVMAGGVQGVREEETFMGKDCSWQCICGISFPNSCWRKEQSKEVPAFISDRLRLWAVPEMCRFPPSRASSNPVTPSCLSKLLKFQWV